MTLLTKFVCWLTWRPWSTFFPLFNWMQSMIELLYAGSIVYCRIFSCLVNIWCSCFWYIVQPLSVKGLLLYFDWYETPNIASLCVYNVSCTWLYNSGQVLLSRWSENEFYWCCENLQNWSCSKISTDPVFPI